MSTGKIVAGAQFIAGAAMMVSSAGTSPLAYQLMISGGLGLAAPNAKDLEGPRLSDLTVQTSTYGAAIPTVYGTMRAAGNVIWSAAIVETMTQSSQSAKGDDSVKTNNYAYSQSFAVALCDGEIVGIAKIWANGELIYNVSEDASASTVAASTSTGETFTAFGMQITVPNPINFTLHNGTESQLADSTIQAAQGADTPAYRGTAYVVFHNLPLADYGNRTPNLEFEVVCSGAYSVSYNPSDFAGVGTFISSAYGNNKYLFIADAGLSCFYESGSFFTRTNNLPYTSYYDSLSFYDGAFYAGVSTGVYRSYDGVTWASVLAGTFSTTFIDLATGYIYALPTGGTTLWRSLNGIDWQHEIYPAIFDYKFGGAAHDGVIVICGYQGFSPVGTAVKSASGVWSVIGLGSGHSHAAYGNGLFIVVSNGTSAVSSDGGASWTTASVALSGPASIIYSDGLFVVSASNGLYHTDNGLIYTFIAIGHARAVETNSSGQFIANTGVDGMKIFGISNRLVSTPVTLSSIVSNICTSSGLSAGDIDVTQLTDNVDGYLIASRSTARSGIEPLMGAYYFDAIESDGKVEFIKRGASSGVTIVEDDLAARDYHSEAGDALSIERVQDVELPQEVVVKYLDSDAAYIIGNQYSRRLTGSSINKIDVEMPLSISATKAKQIAEVLLFNAWQERNSYKFETGSKYSYLEPADVVQVYKGGVAHTVRITSTDYQRGICTFSAVAEDATVYTQNAVAVALPVQNNVVEEIGLTDLRILDIPLLRDQDDGVGFYTAAAGLAGAWSGCVIYKSLDDGASYSQFGNPVLNKMTYGLASTVLGDFNQNIFDETNTVTVVMKNGTLSSVAEINVLNGENAALLGDEIIQFKTATLTAANTYKLSGLLRGRKGTEWARSIHALNDDFILLSTSYLAIQPATNAEFNIPRKYTGVTFNTYLDSAVKQDFTFQAVAQECYAPVLLGGGRNAYAFSLTDYVATETNPSNVFSNSISVSGNYAYTVNFYTHKLKIFDITTPSNPILAGEVTTDLYPRSVAVSGNYAFVVNYGTSNGGGTAQTLQSFNVSTPYAPFLVGSVTIGSSAREVKVSGNYAYIVSTNGYLNIYNITTPSSPSLSGLITTVEQPMSVAVSGSYAYVVTTVELKIYNISTPSAPTLTGSISMPTNATPQSVVVSGNYAYVVTITTAITPNYTLNALKIYDVSTPTTPTLTSSTSTSAKYPKSVYKDGNYAHIAIDGGYLEIYDISTPATPSSVGSVNTGTTNYPNSVYASGNYAYLISGGSTGNFGGLQIFDVTTPASPALIGDAASNSYPTNFATSGDYIYATGYPNALKIFDKETMSLIGSIDTTTGSNPVSVAVSGNYAYVVNEKTDSLQIFNVTTPATPTLTGSISTGDKPSCVAISGSYAYVVNYAANTLQIFNVTTPATPTLTGSTSTGGSANPISVVVSGSYAYIINYTANTLQIYNVSTPASPTLTGSISTGANPISVVVSGSYAYVVNYTANTLQIYNVSTPATPTLTGSISTTTTPTDVYLDSSYAYVSCTDSLKIFDISNPATPVLVASSTVSNKPNSVTYSGGYVYVLNDDGNLQSYIYSSSEATLTWTRRTRISGGWTDYADVPLGEAAESYEVDIYSSNTYATVLRTITGITTPTTTYTAAQQITDGLTPGNPVYFKVYQLSATNGRGYEARGVV